MLETAKCSPPKSVRVVHVSSAGHYVARAQPLNFASFKDGAARNKYFTQELYLQSKFVSKFNQKLMGRLKILIYLPGEYHCVKRVPPKICGPRSRFNFPKPRSVTPLGFQNVYSFVTRKCQYRALPKFQTSSDADSCVIPARNWRHHTALCRYSGRGRGLRWQGVSLIQKRCSVVCCEHEWFNLCSYSS
jgi:hypothetical protein